MKGRSEIYFLLCDKLVIISQPPTKNEKNISLFYHIMLFFHSLEGWRNLLQTTRITLSYCTHHSWITSFLIISLRGVCESPAPHLICINFLQVNIPSKLQIELTPSISLSNSFLKNLGYFIHQFSHSLIIRTSDEYVAFRNLENVLKGDRRLT